MGIHDRDYYRDEDERGSASQYVPRTMVTRLIVINVIVFLVDLLFGGDRHFITGFLALDSRDAVEPWKLWHLVSYAFAHNPFQIAHILGNMYGLWFFGRELEEHYGAGEFLRIYLVGGVMGGLVWLVRTASMGLPAELIGASGAVMTVTVLYCLRFPTRRILLFMIIPVPAWMLGILYVAQDLFSATSGRSGSNVAYDVHLAGAAFGFLYYHFDWNLSRFSFPLSRRRSARPGQAPWWSWFSARARRDRDRERELNVYIPDSPPPTAPPRPRPSRPVQDDNLDEQADAILAKIHQQGDASLTAAERKTLEEYSRRMRERRK